MKSVGPYLSPLRERRSAPGGGIGQPLLGFLFRIKFGAQSLNGFLMVFASLLDSILARVLVPWLRCSKKIFTNLVATPSYPRLVWEPHGNYLKNKTKQQHRVRFTLIVSSTFRFGCTVLTRLIQRSGLAVTCSAPSSIFPPASANTSILPHSTTPTPPHWPLTNLPAETQKLPHVSTTS